jgi:uncharacterized membrane protein
MQLTPVIAIHMSAAIVATVIGPIALWARLGRTSHPKLHRAFGYAWVTLMIVVAISAIFIRASPFPSFAGFSPIHLLVPYTLGMIFFAFKRLFEGNITAHRKYMQGTYIGACLVAGAFTLAPGRYLGNLIWSQWLGLV